MGLDLLFLTLEDDVSGEAQAQRILFQFILHYRFHGVLGAATLIVNYQLNCNMLHMYKVISKLSTGLLLAINYPLSLLLCWKYQSDVGQQTLVERH